MRLRKFLALSGLIVGGVVVLLGLAAGGLYLYLNPKVTRQDGIVYTQRHGQDLTFGIVRPRRPNGLGVLVMVSGGWKSQKGPIPTWLAAPLLRRGYTIFAVSHLSQPEATVMEIVEDVNRAVRFIRYHAGEYGIDPDRLGVTGGSAGGHLSLMLATRGGPGKPDAPDPVDRVSSAVQAVAIFFPATDLLNLGDSTENLHDGGPPKSFVKAFGPQSTNREVWAVIGREMSPIYHAKSNMPPVLIIHGSADTLTPLDQSERFRTAALSAGAQVELVVRKGKKHGWLTMVLDERLMADWFDRHLLARRLQP